MNSARQAFVLVGPTAVGKSAVSEILAAKSGRAILVADSMQIYRGFDIGTAKPPAETRRAIPHVGLDLADPDAEFSVGDYVRAVREQIEPGAVVICAGGTGLYIKALTEGLAAQPPRDPIWRAQADRILAAGGVAALQDEVRRRAPAAYAALRDPLNPRRLVRAVERTTPSVPVPARPKPRLTGLRMDVAALSDRIARRVESMFAGGLVEEVQHLRQAWPTWSATARQAIGYAEALTHLDGRCTLTEAIENTILRTRQLAKRQMTWFRNQADVDWVDIRPAETVEAIAARVHASWEEYGPIDLAL